MEDFILSTVDFVQNVDFNIVFQAIGLGFLLVWISMAVWVWKDASQRFESKVVPIVFGVLTLIFFVFGYLAYMILRPKNTIEDNYWEEREKEFLMHEIGDYDICPNCKYDRIFVEFLKCPNCGFEIKHKCEGCSFALTKYWKHCPSCGTENKNYDPKVESDPNTVLVGEREKKQQVMEEAEKKDAKPLTKAKVKKSGSESPLKKVVDVYVGFFSTIGNGIIGAFNGVKKGVGSGVSKVKTLFTRKAKPKANIGINSEVSPKDLAKKKAKTHNRRKRKRNQKKKAR